MTSFFWGEGGKQYVHKHDILQVFFLVCSIVCEQNDLIIKIQNHCRSARVKANQALFHLTAVMGTDTTIVMGLGVSILQSQLPDELKPTELFEEGIENGVEFVQQFLQTKFDDEDFEFRVSMDHPDDDEECGHDSVLMVFVPMLTDEYHGALDGTRLVAVPFDNNITVCRAQDLVERLKLACSKLSRVHLPLQWVLHREISM